MASHLLDLRRTVEDLDPSQARGSKKFLGMIPFGDKVTDYFRRYESAQGHLDGTARVLSIVEGDGQRTVRIALDAEHAHLVVRKGSIAVDGISLTTSAVSDPSEAQQWFEVSLIPETLASTTLGFRAVGDRVNIETDIVARHVERMLQREAS